MSYLVVSPLSCLNATAAQHRPGAMVTLISAGTPVTRPVMVAEHQHLCLYFNDITEERQGLVAPAAKHVAQLLQFVRAWPRTAPLLLHCMMGISRSTAAAFIAACALNPQRAEAELAARLRVQAPSATPNARLIRLADSQLGRAGRMTAAIKHIGRGCDAGEGTPFVLDYA